MLLEWVAEYSGIRKLTRIPGKSDLAQTLHYGLSRWSSFCSFLEDGRVAIDNNAAERAKRPIGPDWNWKEEFALRGG